MKRTAATSQAHPRSRFSLTFFSHNSELQVSLSFHVLRCVPLQHSSIYDLYSSLVPVNYIHDSHVKCRVMFVHILNLAFILFFSYNFDVWNQKYYVIICSIKFFFPIKIILPFFYNCKL